MRMKNNEQEDQLAKYPEYPRDPEYSAGLSSAMFFRLLTQKFPDFNVEIQSEAARKLPGDTVGNVSHDKLGKIVEIRNAIFWHAGLGSIFGDGPKIISIDYLQREVKSFCERYGFSEETTQAFFKYAWLRRQRRMDASWGETEQSELNQREKARSVSMNVEPLTDDQVEQLISTAIDQEAKKIGL